MSFKVTVVELKTIPTNELVAGTPSTQVYEQTVETLDLPKVIAAVNYKKRERRPRGTAASATPQRP